MSIKSSSLFATVIFTAILASPAAFAQTAAISAPHVQKPTPPMAPSVAPVAPATAGTALVTTSVAAQTPAAAHRTARQKSAAAHAEYLKKKQAHEARFKPLTPAEQTHIAVTHEHAARQRYYHDIHNLDNLTPEQRADMKQELAAWFASLPLTRQVDLKRRDEILFGKNSYHPAPRQIPQTEKKIEPPVGAHTQKAPAKKQKMPIVQITTSPATDTMTKTIIKTAPAQPVAPKAAAAAESGSAAAPVATPTPATPPHALKPIPVTR